jgi:hypothetical protein
MIISGFLVQRLVGSSDILYVGSSESIGGVERTSRLWTYRYPNKLTNEARMRDYIERLAREGKVVFLYLCESPPNNMTVGDYESRLLQRYRDEHWELPPWNSSA